jgi:hypothetical protein
MAAANFSESVGSVGLFERDISNGVASGTIRRMQQRPIPDQVAWIGSRAIRPELHRILTAITLRNARGDTEIIECVAAALLDAVDALEDVDTTQRWELMLTTISSEPIGETGASPQDSKPSGADDV